MLSAVFFQYRFLAEKFQRKKWVRNPVNLEGEKPIKNVQFKKETVKCFLGNWDTLNFLKKLAKEFL